MTKKKKEVDIYKVSDNDGVNASFRALSSGIKSLLNDPAYEDNEDLAKMKEITSELSGGKEADPKAFNLADEDSTNALIRAGARMIRSFSKEETIANSKFVKIVKDVVGIEDK